MINIELPKDAESREIPLGTLVLYDKDGSELDVKRIEFNAINKKWNFAVQKGSSDRILLYRDPQDVYLEKPAPLDSWEKLLDDLDNAAKGGDNAECLYMRGDGIEYQCQECKLCMDESDLECAYLAYADIAARIRRLRGEER